MDAYRNPETELEMRAKRVRELQEEIKSLIIAAQKYSALLDLEFAWMRDASLNQQEHEALIEADEELSEKQVTVRIDPPLEYIEVTFDLTKREESPDE